MDDTINRLSGQPERFKKYNPNPIPETQPTWDVPQLPEPQFPEYEEWTRQIEGGERQPQFPSTGLPTEMPGAMPTETGMPTEAGYPDVLNQIMGTYGIEDPMEALDLLISMSAGEQGLLGLTGLPGEEEGLGVEKPIEYPATKREFIEQKIAEGVKASEIKGLADLLYPEIEANVQSNITRMMDEGLIYEQIWEFLTNKETGLGLSNSDATKEISEWVEKNNQDIPLK